ncbi:hypothetical protein, partial [Paraburkholderia bannensis]|uniref:hypothetical protein n=1 Tax=Paraburkholderia bannensis TaxID=765414 RepID=UPI002ABD9FCB
MKERPILFNGPMIRALANGTKTQTRRIVKQSHICESKIQRDDNGALWSHDTYRCPHGVSGDRLWVRETLAPTRAGVCGDIVDWHYAADGAKVPRMPGLAPQFSDAMAFAHLARMSVPSIHMPRWASRITLEVTGVRVERLQAISEADAEAEGIGFLRQVPDYDETLTARDLFHCLWDAVTPKDTDWNANPWVWVIEFQRINGAA